MKSGKTTTSGLVYSELINSSETEHLFNGKTVSKNSLQYNSKGDVIDFTSVLNVGKIKVGIISPGDVANSLKININIMIELNIDILICCARSVNKKGSAYRMILDEFSVEHKIVREFWTNYSKDIEQKNNVKMKTISEIIEIITQ